MVLPHRLDDPDGLGRAEREEQVDPQQDLALVHVRRRRQQPRAQGRGGRPPSPGSAWCRAGLRRRRRCAAAARPPRAGPAPGRSGCAPPTRSSPPDGAGGGRGRSPCRAGRRGGRAGRGPASTSWTPTLRLCHYRHMSVGRTPVCRPARLWLLLAACGAPGPAPRRSPRRRSPHDHAGHAGRHDRHRRRRTPTTAMGRRCGGPDAETTSDTVAGPAGERLSVVTVGSGADGGAAAAPDRPRRLVRLVAVRQPPGRPGRPCGAARLLRLRVVDVRHRLGRATTPTRSCAPWPGCATRAPPG